MLSYGWAYGSKGTKLKGKDFILAITIGGPESDYQAGGKNKFTTSELTKPFQATANLIGMRFLPIFKRYGVRLFSGEDLQKSAEDLVKYLKAEY